jgi:hypothetical protein
MLFRHIAAAFVVCIIICAGLSSGQQQAAAAERPAALILSPGSTGVRFDEQGNTARLSYHVSSKFPATSVIDWISDQLQKAGWKPLKYDFLNPNSPSSHVTGWPYQLDGTKNPALCVHQWLGDWRDPSGNIVRYGFRYKQLGCSTLALTDLEVTGWYTPADVVRQMQQLSDKLKKDRQPKVTSAGS